jgi:hypothetical protein
VGGTRAVGMADMPRQRWRALPAARAERRLAGAPAEFLLAAACCRWPHSQARVYAIQAASRRPIDWMHFLRVVERHRIWALANDGLRRAGVGAPVEVLHRLGLRAQEIARTNLLMVAECLKLQRMSSEAGIGLLFLKGIPLALLAYGDVGIKHGRDIDLLVAPEDLDNAIGMLESAGYELVELGAGLGKERRKRLLGHAKEFELLHRSRRLRVELHWLLEHNPYLLEGAGLPAEIQAVELADGAVIHTLAGQTLFNYLSVHGARHIWYRLKWLADLAALLNTDAYRDLEALYGAARAGATRRCAGLSLLLCERLFGVVLAPSLAKELHADPILRFLEVQALNGMLRGRAVKPWDDSPDGSLYPIVPLLLLGGNRRYFRRELWLQAVGTRNLAALPLPRSLYWLYPLMRIPTWLWRLARAWVRRVRSAFTPGRA